MTAKAARVSATLLAIMLGVCACVTPNASDIPFSPAARPAEGMALVYVFRIDPSAAAFTVPVARIDGSTVLPLQSEEYTAVYLQPGRHTASLEPGGFAAARDLDFVVAAGQVAALGLAFMRTPRMQSEIGVETKQGLMTMPTQYGRDADGGPFSWAFIANIEADPLYRELRQRRFRAASTPAH